MIPKIIHQTWKSTIVPDEFKHNVSKCEGLDYEHKLWTDDEMDLLVKTNFPLIYPIYVDYPYHIQRCDAFRYMVLYLYGGIYIDIDIECKDGFDDLLKNDLVLAYSLGKMYKLYEFITNEFMMSSKHNHFMLQCILQLSYNAKQYETTGIQYLNVFHTTGPAYLTKQYSIFAKKYTTHNVIILNNTIFGGDCTPCNKKTCIGGKYIKHHYGGTWHNTYDRFIEMCNCNTTNILILIIYCGIFSWKFCRFKSN
jgi:mannosyltransferase OCH1-like enzyme